MSGRAVKMKFVKGEPDVPGDDADAAPNAVWDAYMIPMPSDVQEEIAEAPDTEGEAGVCEASSPWAPKQEEIAHAPEVREGEVPGVCDASWASAVEAFKLCEIGPNMFVLCCEISPNLFVGEVSILNA